MESPFPYDKITSSEYFYGREKELKELDKVTTFSNNLLIYSKRRMGKSSLVTYFLESKKEQYLNIYVDVFDITTKEDFAYALLKGLANAKKGDIKTILKTFTNLFKRVRLEPTVDPVSLKYSLKPVVATLSFEQMMDDFFDTLDAFAKSEKIIVAIDEFQQIASIKDIKLDAYLRKFIQNRNNTSYLFLGSKRHLLHSLFEYKAPLYELASHFELGPLKIEAIHEYAKKYLPIGYGEIEYLYDLAKGETKLIQNSLHLLYFYKYVEISKEHIDTVLNEILQSKESSYRLVYDTLNNNQKTALKIIGKYKSRFFNDAIFNEYRIKKQTLQSAINSLFKKEIIDKEGDAYFIPDRTLELWVEMIL